MWILEAVVVKKGEELRGLITENEGEDVEGELEKEEAMEMVSMELWLIATTMDVVDREDWNDAVSRMGKEDWNYISFDWWASEMVWNEETSGPGHQCPPIKALPWTGSRPVRYPDTNCMTPLISLFVIQTFTIFFKLMKLL